MVRSNLINRSREGTIQEFNQGTIFPPKTAEALPKLSPASPVVNEFHLDLGHLSWTSLWKPLPFLLCWRARSRLLLTRWSSPLQFWYLGEPYSFASWGRYLRKEIESSFIVPDFKLAFWWLSLGLICEKLLLQAQEVSSSKPCDQTISKLGQLYDLWPAIMKMGANVLSSLGQKAGRGIFGRICNNKKTMACASFQILWSKDVCENKQSKN